MEQRVQLGEVVLIVDENARRPVWRMGVIAELFPGRDGVVRAVSVKTTRGVFKRAVQKLCALEICEDVDVPANPAASDGTNEESGVLQPEEIEAGALIMEPPEPVESAPPSRGENVGEEIARTRSGRAVRPVRRLGIDP